VTGNLIAPLTWITGLLRIDAGLTGLSLMNTIYTKKEIADAD
jgi:hypothetical protein